MLAIGNSVADWVADSVVAMSGKPEMAVGSCFGAPLLSNVIGLSIALLVSRNMVLQFCISNIVYTPTNVTVRASTSNHLHYYTDICFFVKYLVHLVKYTIVKGISVCPF